MPIIFDLYCFNMATGAPICVICFGEEEVICGYCKKTTNYFYDNYVINEDGFDSNEYGEESEESNHSNECSVEDSNKIEYMENMKKQCFGFMNFMNRLNISVSNKQKTV